MEREEILSRFYIALSIFYIRDYKLVEVNASERSMTHKLAIYLEFLFPEYDVDCEYNRDGCDPKKIKLSRNDVNNCSNERKQSESVHDIYPDIIVHKRNARENLLVIEAKKKSIDNKQDCDYTKLRALTNLDNYAYNLGIGFSFEKEFEKAKKTIKTFSNKS